MVGPDRCSICGWRWQAASKNAVASAVIVRNAIDRGLAIRARPVIGGCPARRGEAESATMRTAVRGPSAAKIIQEDAVALDAQIE